MSATVGLAERNAAITRLCMALEPADEDLDRAGDRERWLLYRSMVRTRLEEVCRTAFERGVPALGDERFLNLFARWLDAEGPRTAYFWHVPLEMMRFAMARLEEEGIDAAVLELLRFEGTRWRTRNEPFPDAPPADALAFERPIVLNPTLVQLDVAYPVHEGTPPFPAEPTRLLLFRAPRIEELCTWTLNPFAAALVERCRAVPDEALADAIRAVADARGSTMDAGLIDSLGELLAQFLEHGIVLGGRPAGT